MRSNTISTEPSVSHGCAYSSSINKSLAYNNITKQYYNLIDSNPVDCTEESNDNDFFKNSRKIVNEMSFNPLSIYDNYSNEVKFGIEHEKSRKSRQHDHMGQKDIYENKKPIKRDRSMPPISARYYIEDKQQQFITATKHSIDGDLNVDDNNFDISIFDMYDSIITNVSVTPPPVQMIHEYANKKAIIRPLAFRPVQSDRSQIKTESSPPKPPMVAKVKVGQVRRISPPPVPPHANRVPLKSKVPSLKSGDSSGYYSSRTVGTVNDNTSSTDISPIFDDPGSILDDVAISGEIYANADDFSNDYHVLDEIDRGLLIPQSLSEMEISSERERCNILESALVHSNAELIKAESHINELKVRLSQKSSEISNAKENLTHCKRSLERQIQKTHNLERSIQSIKFDLINKEKVTKEKITQTNLSNNEYSVNNLLEQFDEERRTWLDEKVKVLTYQTQIESNYQKLLMKTRHLEHQIVQLKTHDKEFRYPHSYPSTHSDDNEKLSVNSGGSSAKHQASV